MTKEKGEEFQEYVYKADCVSCESYPNCQGCSNLYFDDCFEVSYCACRFFTENIRLSDKVDMLKKENEKLLRVISQMEVYK